MELNLEKKVVLITASGQGLGKGIAEGFLSENATVIITDILPERLEQTKEELQKKYKEADILAIADDLTKDEGIINCVETSINHFGKIDILIANLGSGRGGQEWNPNENEWTRIINLNFEGARKITNAVVPFMQKQEAGNVIFISSIAGKEVIGAPLGYSVAKASLIAYSKNLSFKLASDNIRTNVICPGNIFFENGTWDIKIKENPASIKSMLESKVPQKRFTNPEEIANLVLFLASNKSSFITGSSIVIDGGQTVSI